MRPSFAGHPIAELIFFATFGVWIAIEIRQALNRRPDAANRDRGSLLVVRLCGGAAAILAALAIAKVPAAHIPFSYADLAIGLSAVVAGVGLRWWSFSTLGRYFTFTVMTSAGQPVVADGPYRIVRHPGYAAILLILAGTGLLYGNWLSLAALVVLPLIGLLNRIRVEEAALASTLGAAYTTYAQGRKRLVPFVW